MTETERETSPMTSSDTLRDDLAFLRNLVAGSEQWLGGFGEGYFAAGLIYGTQMLLHAGQALGLVPVIGWWPLAVGVGPTLVFIPVIVWINWRHRRHGPATPSGKAVTAVFGVAGLANFGLMAVVGAVALRERSIATWLIYPCTVFILQGSAWLVAYALRRRAWFTWVSAGWYVSGVAMGFFVTNFGAYILIAGLAIWVLMAGSGWVMMRSRSTAAAA